MTKQKPNPSNQVQQMATQTIDQIEKISHETGASIEHAASPIRKHILKRFPALFLLLVTFGVASTFLGIEQLLLQYGVFKDNPIILFIVGIAVLVLTGTLYKKLG